MAEKVEHSAEAGNLRVMKWFARCAIPTLLAALLLTGCATRYEVKVDGLSALEGRPKAETTYRLVSETAGVEETDLFFREIARQLDPVLREAGYRPVAGDGEPDWVIEVDAHLSDPLVETRRYSEPIYLQTHGRTGVVRIPVKDKEGNVSRYVYRNYYTGPRVHFAGYVDHDRQFTVYDKVLRLSARVWGPEGAAEEVWSLKVSLRDGSTDYRAALPYLLVAARPYIGKRTEGEEIEVIKQDDPEVEAFRNRMATDG